MAVRDEKPTSKRRVWLVAVVLLVAVVIAFLAIRWMLYGPGNATDNGFTPPPITPASATR
jgi:hypothetical protein